MKAVIVNCFDNIENRVDLVCEFFKKVGYEVIVIQSNFRHIKKKYRKDSKEDFIFVKTRPYYKNLSLDRLLSHYKYANDAFEIVEQLKPDLLYIFAPPNSLLKFATNYKIKYKKIKLIIDLIDLWPESLPIKNIKKLPPFTLWSLMRNNSFKYADLVITECNLYKDILGKKLKGVKTETIYLANREIDLVKNPHLSDREVHLAYLGSINNIIDIPRIKKIIEVISKIKPVTLHIIGDGEKKQELIDSAQAVGATVEYYGKIYEPQKKQEIFDKCHYGLNIYNENICVGLTMKSIDYFQHGLPILNNIPADTAEIVENYGVGINILEDEDINLKIINLTLMDNKLSRINAIELFKEKFSADAFFKKMELTLKKYLII